MASDPFAPPTLQLSCKLDGIWQHISYMQLTGVSWILQERSQTRDVCARLAGSVFGQPTWSCRCLEPNARFYAGKCR